MPLGSVGGGVGGALGGIIGLATAPKGGMDQYRKAVEAWQKLEGSNFDMSALSPPELQLVGQYFPETYDAIVPEGYVLPEAPTAGREGQVSSLGQLQEIAEKGMSPLDRIQADRAAGAVTSASRAGQLDALRNLAARGQLGSGQEIQARLAGGQQANQLAADLGTGVAEASMARRLQAIQGAGAAAGQLRGADEAAAGRSADVINRFRELVAASQNQAAMQGAAARERAQFANVGERQRVADINSQQRYSTALANLERQNALRGQTFGQQLARTEGLSGAYTGYGQARDAARASYIQGVQQIGSGIGQTAGGVAGGGLGGIF